MMIVEMRMNARLASLDCWVRLSFALELLSSVSLLLFFVVERSLELSLCRL